MSQQPPFPGYGQPPYGQPPKSQGPNMTIIIFVILGVGGVAALCIIGILVALLLPAISAAREAAARASSMNNLKQIGVALHNYHDTYRAFPAAHIDDASGKPMTSWRASLIPFVGQPGETASYNTNLPWDDAANSAARQAQVTVYQSPRDQAGMGNRTSYVVVTAEKHMANPGDPMKTIFPGQEWTGIQEIRDGTSNTIAVVEIKNSDIEWSEPRDIDIDSLSTDPNAPNCVDLQKGAVVLFADASVQVLPPNTSLETLKAMLTRGGAEQVSPY